MAKKNQSELNSPIVSSDELDDSSDSLHTASPNFPLAIASDDSGSDTGAGSDSESSDQAAMASKPIEVAKPQSLPTTSTKASAKTEVGLKKRKATEVGLNDSSKKARKKIATEEKVEEEKDTKRKLFERKWSEKDEISLLKGIMEYMEKKCVDPFGNIKAFRDSVHKSLHFEVTPSQLQDKMRRLRKKFKNNAKNLKPGKEKVFANPHNNQVFALSKKIWAPDGKLLGVVVSSKSNASTKNTKPNGNGKLSQLMPSMKLKVLPGKTMGDTTIEEEILVDGRKYIEESKKLEMEEKWRKLYVEELEFSIKRWAFIKEYSELALEGMKAKKI